ncbi:MAG: hypothetical protein K2Y05_11615 [Hyphomicrobiaceae bacterium]|nr:hypothetical protein [Hyphomicrobiaceae bacterium]
MTMANAAALDPGTVKFVLMFGVAFVVAVWGIWTTTRRRSEFDRDRAARQDTKPTSPVESEPEN